MIGKGELVRGMVLLKNPDNNTAAIVMMCCSGRINNSGHTCTNKKDTMNQCRFNAGLQPTILNQRSVNS